MSEATPSEKEEVSAEHVSQASPQEQQSATMDAKQGDLQAPTEHVEPEEATATGVEKEEVDEVESSNALNGQAAVDDVAHEHAEEADSEPLDKEAESAEREVEGERKSSEYIAESADVPVDTPQSSTDEPSQGGEDGAAAAAAAAKESSSSLSGSSSSGQSSPGVPPPMRYMLPIGGPSKNRPITSKRTSSLQKSSIGPSSRRPKTADEFDSRLRERTPSTASTIKKDSTGKRPSPVRRMSSSDIPTSTKDEEEATERIGSPSPDGAAKRQRAQTISERGERGKQAKSRLRPKTAPATAKGLQSDDDDDDDDDDEDDAISRHDSLSSMMIDGQTFFLDDGKATKKAQSARARSTTTASVAGQEAETAKPSGRARFLSKAADLGDMAFLTRAMRKPVKAVDEPMIYDADELDDIPPPGSYAIHPPSKTRLAEAAGLSLFDEDGNLVKFGSIFEHQRTLIIFLRHWLCPFCQMFAQSIKNVDPLPLQRADLGMVVVGQGHAHVTKSYKEVMKIPPHVRIFADPTRKIYHALGMTLRTNDAGPACMRPDYQTMGVMKASFKAVKHGLVDMPIRLPGDTKLLGGEFILGPGLDCSFTHRMVTVRGHLDLPRILQQAGCDLSLKTPKDVLADGETASARAGSTRSVDHFTARRLARRIARKTRTATPKDILLIKSRRAAEAASQRGSHSKTLATSPSRTTLASAFGSRRTAGGMMNDEAMAGVDGKRTALRASQSVENPSLYVISSPSGNADAFSAGERARIALAQGLPHGWAQKHPLSPSAHLQQRPITADAITQRSFARQQAERTSSLRSTWTSADERHRPSTARTMPPPLPRTSSSEAYEAAQLRQRNNDETEELYSEDGVVRERRVGGSLRRTHRSNLSTSSLGRQDSYLSQYQRDQLRRQKELQRLRARNTISSPNLAADKAALRSPTTDYSKEENDVNGLPRFAHQRTSSSQSLPQNALLAGVPQPESETKSVKSIQSRHSKLSGVPLSVFERRIAHDHAGISSVQGAGVKTIPRINVRRDQDELSPASPMSSKFGEDTDYKRLPRSALASPIAATTPTFAPHTNGSGGDDGVVEAEEEAKTPKARIISLHADELSIPGSARTSRNPPPRASTSEEVDKQRATSDTPPPPVPPKSPPKAAFKSAPPLAATTTTTTTTQQSQRYIPSGALANRAPVPAPTPAFAAILAAEEARRKDAQKSTVSLVSTTAETGPAEAANDKTVPAPATSASMTSSLSGSSSIGSANGGIGGGLPALLAGLPPMANRPTPPVVPAPAPALAPTRSQQTSQSGHAVQSADRQAADPAPVAAVPVDGGSFLDDLETVDGFRRGQADKRSSTDSHLMKSPYTAATSESLGEDDEEEEEDESTYYSNDWEPLHARQNFPASSKATRSNGRHSTTSTVSGGDGEENVNDESVSSDFSENDTEGEDGDRSSPPLALLGVLSKGAKRFAAPGNAIVKRVTSRPGGGGGGEGNDDSHEDDGRASNMTSGSLRSTLSGTLSGSARAIRINRLVRKPVPTTAQSPPLTATGRRLTSFAEEEEEEGELGGSSSGTYPTAIPAQGA